MKLIEEGFFSRNKKIIIISIVIMFLSIVAGAAIGYINSGDNLNAISELMSSDNVSADADAGVSSVYLFIHNLTADMMIIIGGVLFSIFSVLITVFNGVSVGSIFGVDLKFACATVLPHLIFEYTAGALALAIAFKITKIEIEIIKNRNFKDTIKNHKTEFKDMLIIFLIILGLLVIAAIIEGHLISPIANWVYGIK